MGTRTDIRNSLSGPGTQNNNNGAGLQNNVFGGEVYFVENFNPSERNPHRTLWDAVGRIGASHDDEQQYERRECLSGTREKATGRIHRWVSSKKRKYPILWLTGPAGVGKSAIAMTVAKFHEEGALVTSFFFFRSDSRRNNPSALVLSVSRGIGIHIPSIQILIDERISRDPAILGARMEAQFRELILKPFRTRLPLSSSKGQNWTWRLRRFWTKHLLMQKQDRDLVIIDGLDECGNEETQLRVLNTIQSAFQEFPDLPLRFLICSRPEAWLREAFAAKALRDISKVVVLDESFQPGEDIMKYYVHHFREISRSAKYNQVKFPTPWPSVADLEALVERTGGQFIYAATIIRFIKEAFSHPIERLDLILKKMPPRLTGRSPFQLVDALYEFILGVNPRYRDSVLPILAAIIVTPDKVRSPACIELMLGLPSGQLASTLRGMHSVLDIRGRDEGTRLFHNSFREYLVDPTRSGSFHIDETTWKHVIAWMWLQNLSTQRIQSYSSSQLWNEKKKPFFEEWIKFCISIPKPTRDLLNALSNVDLAAPLVILERDRWEGLYKNLVPWVKKYLLDTTAGENQESSKIRGHAKAGENSRLRINGHPSYPNGQRRIEAPSRSVDDRGDDLDLVEGLIHKFQNRPQCFHLEWPPDVSPPDDLMYWIIRRATGCAYYVTRLDGSRPSAIDKVRLTECRCDLSGRNKSRDPGHLAYQKACLKLVRAYVSLFEELSKSGAEDKDTIDQLKWIFWNLTESALLRHCRLSTALLSLCRTFLGLAKGCSIMWIFSGAGEQERRNLLEWFETFPERFAAEREALKVQVLGLPWEHWDQNFRRRWGE